MMDYNIDWVIAAAREICLTFGKTSYEGDEPNFLVLNMVRGIIERYSPFKPDVAYMPVPRCDGCKHWSRWIEGEPNGSCELTKDAWQTENKAKFYAEGGYVRVDTEANFGCVQFEAK